MHAQELAASQARSQADRGHIAARGTPQEAGPQQQDPPEPLTPAGEHVARFDAEMAHELGGGERPGVRSRFPHGLPAFHRTRAQLEARAPCSRFECSSRVHAAGVWRRRSARAVIPTPSSVRL